MGARAAQPCVGLVDLRGVTAPAQLSARRSALWNALRGTIAAGVTSKADQYAFEAIVRLMTVMAPGDAPTAPYARLRDVLSKFGITPVSRSRATVLSSSAPRSGDLSNHSSTKSANA